MVARDEALIVALILANINLPYDHCIHDQSFTVQVCHIMALKLMFVMPSSNIPHDTSIQSANVHLLSIDTPDISHLGAFFKIGV